MPHTPTPAIHTFITRRKASGASERANYQLFLSELCELLGVEKPRAASDKVQEATYSFVLEAKQGADKAGLTEIELGAL